MPSRGLGKIACDGGELVGASVGFLVGVEVIHRKRTQK
jgi:hypothetical protein